jgi:hypothetical protein
MKAWGRTSDGTKASDTILYLGVWKERLASLHEHVINAGAVMIC